MRPAGVTRHQFLKDPRIPYTSHNSGACVGVWADGDLAEVTFAFDFVSDRAAEGSDPGVCIAVAEEVEEAVQAFGREAMCRVVEMFEATDLAARSGLSLRGLGGKDLGVIGALGSVGLRASGNDGRFIELAGLRDLPERVEVDRVMGLGIRLSGVEGKGDPARQDGFETLGWVRPRLEAGQAVLPVEWSEARDAWIPVDRKGSQRV
jgi:hypothetical protein